MRAAYTPRRREPSSPTAQRVLLTPTVLKKKVGHPRWPAPFLVEPSLVTVVQRLRQDMQFTAVVAPLSTCAPLTCPFLVVKKVKS